MLDHRISPQEICKECAALGAKLDSSERERAQVPSVEKARELTKRRVSQPVVIEEEGEL